MIISVVSEITCQVCIWLLLDILFYPIDKAHLRDMRGSELIHAQLAVFLGSTLAASFSLLLFFRQMAANDFPSESWLQTLPSHTRH
jgi:hypothetical protein